MGVASAHLDDFTTNARSEHLAKDVAAANQRIKSSYLGGCCPSILDICELGDLVELCHSVVLDESAQDHQKDELVQVRMVDILCLVDIFVVARIYHL